jgi:triosephosphate isomerase
MLEEIGIDWSIIGHSEKRTYEGETSFDCNRKIKALVAKKMHAIYCVGETAKEYDEGITKDVIKAQIVTGLQNIGKDEIGSIVIAYEPVWSIGTGKNASDAIAEDVCGYIRSLISDLFGKVASQKILILYGGSVKPENIHDYLKNEDVDGALVGGASLKTETFRALLENI